MAKIPQFGDAESQHEVHGEALIRERLRAMFWLGYDLVGATSFELNTRYMVD